jgi:NADH-quinone oxidoreductase subunit C
MDATELRARLEAAAPGVSVDVAPTVDLHTTIVVAADGVLAVARALRDDPGLRFALLADLIAVDFRPREPRFELVYILVSIEHRQRVRLTVPLADEHARVPTVSGLWPSANWLEREVWDLFGIAFDGHPDPRRLLMPEDWEGHPLRKDYPVQIVMKPRTFEPMQVTEEEFRANLSRDRLSRP